MDRRTTHRGQERQHNSSTRILNENRQRDQVHRDIAGFERGSGSQSRGRQRTWGVEVGLGNKSRVPRKSLYWTFSTWWKFGESQGTRFKARGGKCTAETRSIHWTMAFWVFGIGKVSGNTLLEWERLKVCWKGTLWCGCWRMD